MSSIEFPTGFQTIYSINNSWAAFILIVYKFAELPVAFAASYVCIDDTHLRYADNDITKIERNLTNDLESIREWLIVNKLTLNMSKTDFMIIGSRQRL